MSDYTFSWIGLMRLLCGVVQLKAVAVKQGAEATRHATPAVHVRLRDYCCRRHQQVLLGRDHVIACV